MNGSNGVAELEEVFAGEGYTFRHFPDATVAMMTWQAGRNVTDVIVHDGDISGTFVERFELLAWAATSEDLIAKLSAID